MQLDPQIQDFIDELSAMGGKPLYEMSYEDARNFLTSLQGQYDIIIPAQIEDIMIPFKIEEYEGELSLRIVRPADYQGGLLPVIMYFHGGGWILGNEITHDRLIREIANGAQAAVVFVNYTPSPEAQYPVIIEQVYTATKYIFEHGTEMDLDVTRIAVAGDSVGGNMVAVVTQLAKYDDLPIVYQALLYPVVGANFNTKSYNEFANGPWLTKKAMQWFWDAYESDVSKRIDPLLSPLNTPLDDLAGLPPTLVITDENDVLRDEGEAYAHKLMQAGVHVSAVRVLGAIHDFMMLNAISDSAPTRFAVEITNMKLYQALHP